MIDTWLAWTARTCKPLMAAALCTATWAQAVEVDYSLSALGGDLWRYTYTLDHTAGGVDFDEFTVYFDLPDTVEIVAFSAPSGWDALIVQPDTDLPAPGFFDALHLGGLVASGSVVSGFSVDFRQSVGVTPGAQTFELVRSEPFAVVGGGITSPVPEPGVYALLLLGLGVVGAASRRAGARA